MPPLINVCNSLERFINILFNYLNCNHLKARVFYHCIYFQEISIVSSDILRLKKKVIVRKRLIYAKTRSKRSVVNIPTDQSKTKIPLFSCHYTCYKLAEFSPNIKADSIIVTNYFWSAAHLQFSYFFLFFGKCILTGEIKIETLRN